MSQQKEDFIAACENILHFIGGVPAAILPDNLKAAVTKAVAMNLASTKHLKTSQIIVAQSYYQ